MKLRKPIIWGSIGGLAAAILAGLYLYLTVDEPPPRDDDLRPARVPVPDEQNGYLALAAFTEQVRLNHENVFEIQRKAFMADWDPFLAGEILRENQEALEAYDACLEAPEFQLPQIESLFYESTDLRKWHQINELVSIRLMTRFQERKEREALEDAVKMVRFGHRLQGAGGLIRHYMVGRSIKDSGVANFLKIVSRTSLSPQELAACLAPLKDLTPDESVLVEIWKRVYSLHARLIDDIALGNVDPVEVWQGSKSGLSGLYRSKLFFNPNRTKRLNAERLREAIRMIHSLPDFQDGPFEESWFPAKNVVGSWILGDGTIYRLTMGFHFRERASLTLARALLALRIHLGARGDLPPSLEALVPEYLEEAPIDPYDGKPLRYSPGKKVLYSVGEDLKDSGGSRESDDKAFHDANEPTLRIQFQ